MEPDLLALTAEVRTILVGALVDFFLLVVERVTGAETVGVDGLMADRATSDGSCGMHCNSTKNEG